MDFSFQNPLPKNISFFKVPKEWDALEAFDKTALEVNKKNTIEKKNKKKRNKN